MEVGSAILLILGVDLLGGILVGKYFKGPQDASFWYALLKDGAAFFATLLAIYALLKLPFELSLVDIITDFVFLGVYLGTFLGIVLLGIVFIIGMKLGDMRE